MRLPKNSSLRQGLGKLWKKFAQYAIPTRDERPNRRIRTSKYPISEQVEHRRIGKKKCMCGKVRSDHASELAGSSFSRLGAGILRVQAPGA
jgi:hypothetical protein